MLAREYGIIDGEFSNLRCVMNPLLKVLGLWLGLWLLVLISLINILLSSEVSDIILVNMSNNFEICGWNRVFHLQVRRSASKIIFVQEHV